MVLLSTPLSSVSDAGQVGLDEDVALLPFGGDGDILIYAAPVRPAKARPFGGVGGGKSEKEEDGGQLHGAIGVVFSA